MPRFEAGPATVVVDPEDGCRLVSFTVHGHELLTAYNDKPTGHGCFPMAPYAGRVRGGQFTFDGITHQLPVNNPPNAIHGTVHDRRWDEVGPGEWTIDLGDRWPLGGSVVQRVDLDERRLRLELEVRADDRPMPATCGWHPWWRRRLDDGATATPDVDAATLLVRGADGLPTGATVPAPDVAAGGPWDDCFTDLRRPPGVRWSNGLGLTLRTNAAYAVVFTERDPAVCVEPQTGPPDAFNLGGFTVVEPGSPLRAEVEISWA